jgi:hypothetical protein
MVHSSVSPLRRGISYHLTRGTNQHTGAILFDQFLILMRMRARYMEGSAHVFNHAVAVRGSEQTPAFDHLPVFAGFVFGKSQPSPDPMAEVRILSVLPNPEGPDEGREQVTLGNGRPRQSISRAGCCAITPATGSY